MSFVIQESPSELDKALKFLCGRLKDENFVHEYLLHMVIIYRMLRCVYLWSFVYAVSVKMEYFLL